MKLEELEYWENEAKKKLSGESFERFLDYVESLGFNYREKMIVEKDKMDNEIRHT